MVTIATHIVKGGQNKSTVLGNISYLTAKTKRTIMVDVDAGQGSLTKWFLGDKEIKFDLGDLFYGRCELIDCLHKINDNLYILPNKRKGSDLKEFGETKLTNHPFPFEDLTDLLEKSGFQVCYFDLSPGMSSLEKYALKACNEVVTPLIPEYFSVDGVIQFADLINEINKSHRKSIKHSRIVLSSVNKTFKRHKDALEAFKNVDYKLYEIGQTSKIPDAQGVNKTVFEYDPSNKVIPEFERLTEDLLKTWEDLI